MNKNDALAVRHDLFQTTVMTFENSEPELNAGLAKHFIADDRYWRRDQAEKSDSLNLMELSNDVPEFGRLQSLFINALKAYAREVGWRGEFNLAMQMFPNIAPARHFVPSHNHVAHVAGVYYVQTPKFDDRPTIEWTAPIEDYWRPEEGVLILHDPRFNASLSGAFQHFARVYPKPGLMILFPAFLWHEVTPHFSEEPRLSVAANFTLTPPSSAHEKHLKIAL